MNPLEPDKLILALNTHLMKTNYPVRLTDAVIAPPRFHSRYQATGRKYIYRIVANVNREECLFENNRVWLHRDRLDTKAMGEAAQMLLGHHDFSSFRSAGCAAKRTERTLDEFSVKEVEGPAPWWLKGDVQMIEITAGARAFLYKQVRNMVGTLRSVGLGKMKPSQIQELLQARRRDLAPATAPPEGLYLVDVFYDYPLVSPPHYSKSKPMPTDELDGGE
eukprot:Colp12_sorted_trinity150504_noHs@11070